DSTINTALAVPATTKSNFDRVSSSVVGFNTYSSFNTPTRAAQIGPAKGTPEIASAAEVPIKLTISGLICGFTDTTVAMICTSLLNPSGNNGRIGRSIRREVKVSFSDGRPSRLKKPPGILPAA